MPRAVKALYAALVTALLAASAPAIIAAARDVPRPAAPVPDPLPTPGRRACGAWRSASPRTSGRTTSC